MRWKWGLILFSRIVMALPIHHMKYVYYQIYSNEKARQREGNVHCITALFTPISNHEILFIFNGVNNISNQHDYYTLRGSLKHDPTFNTSFECFQMIADRYYVHKNYLCIRDYHPLMNWMVITDAKNSTVFGLVSDRHSIKDINEMYRHLSDDFTLNYWNESCPFEAPTDQEISTE